MMERRSRGRIAGKLAVWRYSVRYRCSARRHSRTASARLAPRQHSSRRRTRLRRSLPRQRPHLRRRCRHRRRSRFARHRIWRCRTRTIRSTLTRPARCRSPTWHNSKRLDQLIRDGKLYISLQDAIDLALENNLDLAIARYNLPIADTDILRTKAGGSFRGVNTGIVQGTPGGGVGGFGAGAPGAGAGGTTGGAGGAGAGASGLVQSTLGIGTNVSSYRSDPHWTGGTSSIRPRRWPTCSFTACRHLQPNTGIAELQLQPGISHRHQLQPGSRQQSRRPRTVFSTA